MEKRSLHRKKDTPICEDLFDVLSILKSQNGDIEAVFLKFVTERELMTGVVAVVQTFGDRINFQPHIHVLMSEGGTALDGAFHHISNFNDDLIQQLFTHEVSSLLLDEKLIGLSLMQKILSWRHTGFNVHSKVRARDRKETERVGKYMISPLVSLQRLALGETEGKVC